MIQRVRLALCFGIAALPALAAGAPLRQATPVYAQPNSSAPVLKTLEAGTTLPAPSPEATAPAGWIAVQLPGPHEVYVDLKDMTKAQDVKPGAALRAQPSSSAPMIGTAGPDESAEITNIRGRWIELRIDRPITGYVQQSAQAAATPPPVVQPAATTPAPLEQAAPAPRSAAPTNPTASTPPPGPGRAVPIVNRDDGGLAALPRLFEGRFVSTRSPLRPRRPYDYALEDHTGTRIAYVDISRLLLTDQIENYIGRHVAAYGIVRPVPDTKDIVVTVESLQLR